MATKGSLKKAGKGIQKSKSKTKKAVSRKDTKRTKLKVENLDRDGVSLTEVFKLTSTNALKDSMPKKNTLENRTLQKDWEKDRKIREKSKAQKAEMNNSLEKQIESISGFTL